MCITFYSLFNTMLWCGILVLATYLLRRYGRAERRFAGISVTVLLYAFSMARTLLPLDIYCAVILPDRWIYPKFYRWINAERFTVGRYSVSVFMILIGVWAVVACVKILWYSVRYFRLVHGIRKYARPAGEPVQTVFRKVAGEEKRQIAVAVYTAPQIEIPHGIGAFRKFILLPQQPYLEEELYYILKHEYTHFLNHDGWLKQITAFFCMIFWWNPVVLFLKRDMEQAIELRCDLTITKHMKKKERIAYLNTIMSTLREKTRGIEPLYGSTALSTQNNTALRERFEAIMGYTKSSLMHKWVNFVIITCFALMFVFSYFIILQPDYEVPIDDEPNTYYIDIEDSYIIHTHTGEYLFYGSGLIGEAIPEEVAKCFISENCRVFEE